MTYIYINDDIVRDPKQVLAALAEPIRRRSEFVERVAQIRGVAQPTAARHGYTPRQWIEWYEKEPLTDDDFETTLAREDPCEVDPQKCKRGAFKAEVRNTCFNFQFAMGLLRHPAGSIHTLLELWREYMNSTGYNAEKERSRKVGTADDAAVARKAARVAAKGEVKRLRSQMKRAEFL